MSSTPRSRRGAARLRPSCNVCDDSCSTLLSQTGTFERSDVRRGRSTERKCRTATPDRVAHEPQPLHTAHLKIAYESRCQCARAHCRHVTKPSAGYGTTESPPESSSV